MQQWLQARPGSAASNVDAADDEEVSGLLLGAVSPTASAAAAPTPSPTYYEPWAQQRPAWKGVSKEQWAQSSAKHDEYEKPSLPRVGTDPALVHSYGCKIKGMGPGTKNWRCLHQVTTGPAGTPVVSACGEMLNSNELSNIWNGVRSPRSAHRR